MLNSAPSGDRMLPATTRYTAGTLARVDRIALRQGRSRASVLRRLVVLALSSPAVLAASAAALR